MPTLLRPWLLDQIDGDVRRAAHDAAGDWLNEVVEAERREHLGVHFLGVDAEARSRFLDAENYDRAREITGRMSNVLHRHTLYDEVARLNEEMLAQDRHPSSRSWLGRVHLERASYGEAEEKFEGALETYQEIGDRSGEASTRHSLATIALRQGNHEEARTEFEEVLRTRQEIGDRKGEASTQHQLATIALEQGEYEEARIEFQESLRINQEIGDRKGEAMTLAQLGALAADELGRRAVGLRLLHVSHTLLTTIGDAQAEQVGPAIQRLVDEPGYDQDEWQEDVQSAQQSYAEDQGWSLIQEAFPDADLPEDGPPPSQP